MLGLGLESRIIRGYVRVTVRVGIRVRLGLGRITDSIRFGKKKGCINASSISGRRLMNKGDKGRTTHFFFFKCIFSFIGAVKSRTSND